MELQSSDDEYFDTISDIEENKKEAFLSNNFEPNRSTTSSVECNYSISNDHGDIHINSSNYVSSNQIPSINKSYNLIDEENQSTVETSSLNKDLNINSSETIETDSRVPLPYSNESDDSSDPESFLNELNKFEIDEKEKDTKSEDVNINNEKEIEKTNEEIQLEERLKFESLMSDAESLSLQEKSISIKEEGNSLFKSQLFEEAIEKYTNAINTCPLKFKDDHAVFHSNRAAALAKIDKNEDAINDLSIAIDLKPDYLKALVRRAEIREKTDKLSDALEDYRKILKIDPRNWSALHAEQTLPERIRLQQEKMKEEMMGQLKQLGNLILKPFGLSTDNFKMVQDPATGSYSVNFQNK